MRSHGRVQMGAVHLVALFTIVIGTLGLVQPDSMTAIRRVYVASPGRMIAAGTFQLGMGLVLFLGASSSRWPRSIRVFGILMCMQAIAAMPMGADRARVVLELETAHAQFLRAGAVVALLTGIVMAVSVTSRTSRESRSIPQR